MEAQPTLLTIKKGGITMELYGENNWFSVSIRQANCVIVYATGQIAEVD